MKEFTREYIQEMLSQQGYITESGIVMSVYLAMKLSKPLLIEGPPGVGKTSTVESIAKAIGKKIIRINLSEHTDMMDLLGSEYPVPVSSDSSDSHDDITFQW